MGAITKRNVFFVLVVSLGLTMYLGGIGASSAFGCEYPFANGWMTGGGSLFYPPGIQYGGQIIGSRVTHGFVVHCTPRKSDNLEIVDHSTGLKFHLLSLDRTECSDDPDIEPNPPAAAFDTFHGWGPGRCRMPWIDNRWHDCYIDFTFTDGGEPGGCPRDTASITISIDGTVLNFGSDVDCGNHQAHDGF